MVRSDRRIVDRSDIDRHRARGLVEIDAAVRGAAVVLHLERERGVARAVAVRRRCKYELAGIDVGHAHELARGDVHAVVPQRSRAGQRRNQDRCERIRRRIVRVGETEIGRDKRVADVLQCRHRPVRTGGRVVDRSDHRRSSHHRIAVGCCAAGGGCVNRGAAGDGRRIVDQAHRQIGRRAIEIRRGQETHPVVHAKRQRIGVRDRAEIGPNAAAIGRILPAPLRRAHRLAAHRHAGQLVVGGIAGVGNIAEVGAEQRGDSSARRVQRVFEGRGKARGSARDRCVIHGGHAYRQRARRRIEIGAAVGGAAIILHLERESCISSTVRIRHWRKYKQSGVDVRHAHELTRGDVHAVVPQRARCRQRGDFDRGQCVRAGHAHRIGRIGAAEVCCRERVRRVFECGDPLVGADRCVVNTEHVDAGTRVGGAERRRAAVYRSVPDTARRAARLVPRAEGDAIGHAAVPVGIRLETHESVGVRSEQPCRVVRRSAEVAPRAAAVGRVLPGAVTVVDSRYGDALLRAGVRIAHLQSDETGHGRSRIEQGILERQQQIVRAAEDRRGIGGGHVDDDCVRVRLRAAAAGVTEIVGLDRQGRAARVIQRRIEPHAVERGIDVGERAPEYHGRVARAGAGQEREPRGGTQGQRAVSCHQFDLHRTRPCVDVGDRYGIGACNRKKQWCVGRAGLRARYGSDRRVVDRGHVHRHRARRGIEFDAGVGSAAVVLHLEREGRISGAIGVGGRRELEVARGNGRGRDELSGGHRHAGQLQAACYGQRGDFHIGERVRRRIGRIGETKVGDREGVGGVFRRRHRLVRPDRRVVDRSERNCKRLRQRIDAAAGSAAAVLHRPCESCRPAIGVKRRIEFHALQLRERVARAGGNRGDAVRERDRAESRRRHDSHRVGQRLAGFIGGGGGTRRIRKRAQTQ